MSDVFVPSATQPSRATVRRLMWGTAFFLLLAVVGLAYVKWMPYWHKAHVAAGTHGIGSSIVSGKATAPPAAGWQAALGYAEAYFNSVWEALLLALILGAAVQVFVPRRWLHRLIGAGNARSAALAGVLSMGGMMCTCCTAPVVLGLRRQKISMGSALAFFLGNPVLNPATLIFMGFVLGWNFAAIRLVAGIVLIGLTVTVAHRLAPQARPVIAEGNFELAPIEQPQRTPASIAAAFVQEMWNEIITILPGYILIVLLLGASRAWLFSPSVVSATHGVTGLSLLALTGTAFVIPTAAEIPIVQSLLAHGLSVAGAVALLITLPAISLPSLYIVRNAFPLRVLAATFAVVAAFGLAAGLVTAALIR